MLKAKSVLAGLISAAVLATPYVSLAQSTAGTTTTTTTKKTTTKKKAAPSVSQQLEEMRQAIEQQNQQIQSLRQQVQQRDATIQQLQTGVTQAQSEATQAQQAAQAAANQQAVQQQLSTVQTDLADLKTLQTNSASTLQETQKRIVDLESPTAIHYKGVTLTPGGFLTLDTMWRENNTSSDVISTFNGIPFDHSAGTQLTEFRMSARQSRISLLAEGKLANMKLTGYWETDFLGAAPTANENQSTSFNLRQRQLFAQAAFNNGWTITGGQTWSLWTSNKKGIETRQEWIPATIDGQYVVGYDFARLATFRITKNFHNKWWWAIALENPEMLNYASINPVANVWGFPASPAAGPGVVMANPTSADFMPDIVTKVAFEPGWGHYEVKALMRVLRDKIPGDPNAPVPTTTYNDKAFAGGLGVNAIMPLVKGKVDLVLQGNYGRGIGRETDSTNADVTLYPDGAINPLRQAQVLVGLETHPTPKLDWYFYGGDEYTGRAWLIGADGKPYGYGSALADNTGCEMTYPGTAKCQANNRNIQEFTTGFWYRFYKGPAGTLQLGGQYEWIHRNTWWGTSTSPTQTNQPEASQNAIMTSFRYVLP